MWSFLDVTARKQAEEALKHSEIRLRELADAMPQIVWTARPDGQVDYVNKRWFDYSGLRREKAYCREGWKMELHPEDEERAAQAMQQCLQTGQPLQNRNAH